MNSESIWMANGFSMLRCEQKRETPCGASTWRGGQVLMSSRIRVVLHRKGDNDARTYSNRSVTGEMP